MGSNDQTVIERIRYVVSAADCVEALRVQLAASPPEKPGVSVGSCRGGEWERL